MSLQVKTNRESLCLYLLGSALARGFQSRVSTQVVEIYMAAKRPDFFNANPKQMLLGTSVETDKLNI